MDKDDRKDLLDWWDECVIQILFCYEAADVFLSQVFRDVEPESEDEDENMEPACLSIAAHMKMQAAAAAKEKAAIKVHNAAAAATTEEHQPQFSNGGNGLMDVTNTGPGVVAAAPAGAAASQA
jgi:hypothetical protein